jgi:hypothetical protein
MKIAIIGTAGRKEDGNKLSAQLYHKMVEDAMFQIESLRIQLFCAPDEFKMDLVSGGAAWADHIAVSLFLKEVANSLTLYFPCDWAEYKGVNIKDGGYLGLYDNNNRSGSIANYYHWKFSKVVAPDSELPKWQTLHEIQKAIYKGAKFHEVPGGFHARNIFVGQVDVILAYTFGSGNVPKDGGTKHTWDNSSAQIKIHRPIVELLGEKDGQEA